MAPVTGPREPSRRDAGLTLIEMVVALALSSMLIILLGSVTMTTMRSARFAMTKSQGTAEARSTMERMSRMLRLAVVPTQLTSAFTWASPDAVRFYAAVKTDTTPNDPLPTYVEYYWDSTTKCLTEAITPARVITPTPPSGSPYAWDTGRTTRCMVKLASDPTGSTRLLTYYGTPLLNSDGTSPTALSAPDTGMTASDQALVQSVEITLSITHPGTADIPPVVSSNKVTLDNLVLTSGGRA